MSSHCLQWLVIFQHVLHQVEERILQRRLATQWTVLDEREHAGVVSPVRHVARRRRRYGERILRADGRLVLLLDVQACVRGECCDVHVVSSKPQGWGFLRTGNRNTDSYHDYHDCLDSRCDYKNVTSFAVTSSIVALSGPVAAANEIFPLSLSGVTKILYVAFVVSASPICPPPTTH